jgi:hypothetical protein
MKIFGARFVTVAAGLVGATGLLFNVNCGSSSNGTGTAGTGGHAGTSGGTAGTSGGTGGHAGTTGSGTGGTSVAGSGGSAGAAGGAAGGAVGGAAGGAAGGAGHAAGGASGAAGSNTDGGTATAAFAFNFDTSVQGFALNNFDGAGNLVNIEGGSHPVQTWDGAVGMPAVGSIKIDSTFTAYNQFVLTTVNLSPLIDATGKTAQVYVMVDAVDGGANFAGGAQLEANSTSAYHGANGTYTTLTPGQWKLLTLNLGTQAAPFDASQIIQFSVNFSTGSGPEGGTFGAPVHAVFHIDSLTDGSGEPPPPALSHTFDKTTEGYTLSSSIPGQDGGATAPTLTWDGAVGDPTNGSLKITGEFTGYNQKLDVSVNLSPLVDLTGKVIHAKVQLDSGTVPAGYVQVHASSGATFVFVNSAGSGLTAGSFIDVALDLTAAHTANANFDPTQVVQVGVQIGTGSGPEGGAFPTPAPLSFHIDSIVAQ